MPDEAILYVCIYMLGLASGFIILGASLIAYAIYGMFQALNNN